MADWLLVPGQGPTFIPALCRNRQWSRFKVSGKARELRDLVVGVETGSACWEATKAVPGLEGRGREGRRMLPSPQHSRLQLTANEEEFLRTYAGVVSSQLSQLPQHSIDQGESRARRQPGPPQGSRQCSPQS